MRTIDMEHWERKMHFDFFRTMDYPHFNLCMNIDISHFLACTRRENLPFYFSMMHAASLAANKTEEFRCRIRGEAVVVHELVHPSFTYLKKDNALFKFVTAEMKDSMSRFAAEAKDRAENQEAFFDMAGHTDDVLYITCIPWISFTSISHTITLKKDDSVPRISWGKYFNDGAKVMLPFSVQVNHALMDGFHVAKYVSNLEETLNSL